MKEPLTLRFKTVNPHLTLFPAILPNRILPNPILPNPWSHANVTFGLLLRFYTFKKSRNGKYKKIIDHY